MTISIDQVMTAGRLIPVLTIDAAINATPLAQALRRGGIAVLEVTLRTPQALDAIRAIAHDVPGVLVGAGTVLTAADLKASRAAGARFAVSPGLTSELLSTARDMGMPLLPGIATASELMLGLAHGFTAFKFFPAEHAGGIATLKALSAPFANCIFCPTGGISLHSAREYLQLPNVPCVGGSWVAPLDAIERCDWARIESLASEATRALSRFG